MIRLKIRTALWILTILSILSLSVRYYLIHYYDYSLFVKRNIDVAGSSNHIVIAMVICGQRTDEALVMVKSAIIFQLESRLTFVILAEFDIQAELHSRLKRLRVQAGNSFSYELRNLSFPADREKEWRSLFKPCATQRLFLPTVLTNYTNVLYVDTDVIFLNELSDIWYHFHQMNASQIAALVPEHEDPNISWYTRFARHPFYGKLGVNSAVMLMNLAKMRDFKWVDFMNPILTKFKLNLTWGDQDIINILFHYHPDKLYIYPCRYNYRTDHCMYKSICKDAELNGVSVMHGSRNIFHIERQRAFRVIYQTFEKYELGTNIYQNLIQPLRLSLQNTTDTNCGVIMNIFIKNLLRLFGEHNVTSPK